MESKPKKPEPIPANEEDINQMCKKALMQMGVKPDTLSLYCLQLVRWALESGELQLEPGDPRNAPFMDMLDWFEQGNPQKVMLFLVANAYPDENGNMVIDRDDDCMIADPKKEWDPVDLAAAVMDHIDSTLSGELENYPFANPHD